ncbi:hypothetical protein E2C01_002546 [Portunus trituberculatus]|uniref:Uncharacterized protein n=1 Tax=Portunus trituberculatus TaxID=210409 RepID=A0A5B7CK20_PORTR|nr:hypothetical protein [Portunus trituberculatus]
MQSDNQRCEVYLPDVHGHEFRAEEGRNKLVENGSASSRHDQTDLPTSVQLRKRSQDSQLLDVSFDAMVREGGVEAASEEGLSTKTTSTSTEFGEGRETRHPGREQPRVSRALSTSARAGGGVGREINDRVAR